MKQKKVIRKNKLSLKFLSFIKFNLNLIKKIFITIYNGKRKYKNFKKY